MLTLTPGSSLNSLVTPANPLSMGRANLSSSSTSFAQQLANSLENYLSQTDSSAGLQIDILPQQGPISGGRQFLVTVRDATPPPVVPLAASKDPDPKDVSGMLMYSGIPAPAPETNPTEVPITNEADAYWASQPEEVRVLRTIQDWTERGQKAQSLAGQGFTIDPDIMVHLLDPYMTMKIRKDEGYTWVPAIGQNGIPVSPGLSFPGLPSYDPHHPPPGAVIVSTDFAVGLELTGPGNGPAHPVTS